jgi:hypothetical protein
MPEFSARISGKLFAFSYLPDVAARPLATPGAHGVADRLRTEVSQGIDGGVTWMACGFLALIFVIPSTLRCDSHSSL